MDEIYKNPDPISISVDSRKKAGSLTSQVPDKNAKSGKFFFTMKFKGPQVVFSEKAILNNARMEGKVNAQGNIIVE